MEEVNEEIKLRKPDKKRRSFSVVVEYPDGSRESLEVPARDYASAIDKSLKERKSVKSPQAIKLCGQPKSSLPYIC